MANSKPRPLEPKAASNATEFSVSDLAGAIKRAVEDGFVDGGICADEFVEDGQPFCEGVAEPEGVEGSPTSTVDWSKPGTAAT